MDFEVFADKVLVNVFGASLNIIQEGPSNPHLIGFNDMARQQYNKFLFQDGELSPLTGIMQAKMSSMITEIPDRIHTVDMADFVFSFAYRAAVASLFNSELADNAEVNKAFDNFDRVFAMVLAGVPISVFSSADRGRALVKNALLATFAKLSGPFMMARRSMFERFNFSDSDISTSNLAILWASVGNTMPAAYWTLYFILTHKDALRAVEAELASLFGLSGSNSCNISTNDLANMKVF